MEIKINNAIIGGSHPAYIIAELSANHNQQLDEAVKLIGAAKSAGADAVKLQTYTPDTMTIDANNQYFKIKGTIWDGKTLYNLYQEAYTPWEWTSKLKAVADHLEIDLFSTPFDGTAVDYLEEISMPAYKIASFEIVDIPLIRKVARTGKPILMSTGMATLSEIEEAINAATEEGNEAIALLKCTSAYPAKAEDMNLRCIPHLQSTFKRPVGLSDHTLGTTVPVASVTLGAKLIEKHFTLDRSVKGPDSKFSLEPSEFRNMVAAVRKAEKALGTITYGPSAEECQSKVFRRSLFVVKDVQRGETFTSENVRSIRPGNGLHPRYYPVIIDKFASRDIKRGTPLSWELLAAKL
jgi:pseudaminic acid synthase